MRGSRKFVEGVCWGLLKHFFRDINIFHIGPCRPPARSGCFLEGSVQDFLRKHIDCNEVLSGRFTISFFSDLALLLLNGIFAQISAFQWTKIKWCFERDFITSQFSDLKKHQTPEFLLMNDFL